MHTIIGIACAILCVAGLIATGSEGQRGNYWDAVVNFIGAAIHCLAALCLFGIL